VLGAIWGLAFVAVRQAVFELSPVNLALLRWFIVSAFFLPLLFMVGKPKTEFDRKDLPRLLLMAFAMVPGYNLSLNSAEVTVSAGLSGLLIAFAPVLIVILSVLFLGEKAELNLFVALLLAVSGAFVLSSGSINFNDLSSAYGPAEVVLSAACYALFSVSGKSLVHKYGAAPTTIRAGLLGTVMMLPLLLSGNFANQVVSLSLTGWLAVLYLSGVVTVLGYVLFFVLVSHRAVSRVSIQLYLVPIVSVVGGALLLNEHVTIEMVIGGGLMLGAVALTTATKTFPDTEKASCGA
jgi:drug/metabolite transporter (DMT)-like permease